MELLNKINAQLDEFKAKRANLVKELQTEFPSLITPLLSQSKKIESIGWRQYTPYFNDGDECVFGVHNDDIYVNGEDQYDMPFVRKTVWDGSKSVPNEEADPHEIDIVEQIEKVLQSIPEDFYKDLFGDHTAVTIHKDGRIETEEYDHD
jgi:hypothetical protein